MIQEAKARVFKKYTPAKELMLPPSSYSAEIAINPEIVPEVYELILIIPQVANKKFFIHDTFH